MRVPLSTTSLVEDVDASVERSFNPLVMSFYTSLRRDTDVTLTGPPRRHRLLSPARSAARRRSPSCRMLEKSQGRGGVRSGRLRRIVDSFS